MTQNPYSGYGFALSRTDFPKQRAAVADAMLVNMSNIMMREFPGLQCPVYRNGFRGERVTFYHASIRCEVITKMLLHYAANIGFKLTTLGAGPLTWNGVGYTSVAQTYKFAWIPRTAAYTAPMRLAVPAVGELVLSFVGRDLPAYAYYSGCGRWKSSEFASLFKGEYPMLEPYPFTDPRLTEYVYPKIKSPFYA